MNPVSAPVLFKFRLYVMGDTQNSLEAVANLTAICLAYIQDRHEIEFVDVSLHPERALADGIFMTPTLIKLAPSPTRMIVGTLSKSQPVIQALGLEEWSAGSIAIAVIEDNRLVREGLSALLNQLPDLEVVVGGATVDMALLKQANPQVLLLDLGLRNGDSLRVAETVKREFPEVKMIVMDLLPVHEEIMEFVNAGVAGFIMKDATLDDLASTIRAVAGGAHVLPPQATGTLFSQIAKTAVATGRPALESVRMTPRERDVVNLIAEGMSNKEIAACLHIATHTVKSHVRNIMEKLMLHTRLQIAAYAHKDAESRLSRGDALS